MVHTTYDQPAPASVQDDPFYYGQRTVLHYDADGRAYFTDEPLTLDDFLDPQEGDEFVQDSQHYIDAARAWSIFRSRYLDDPTTAVFSDLKILWDIPGLAEPAPDVSVMPNVRNKDSPRCSFDVQAEQARPCLVLEVVSPRYRHKDREDKIAIYAQAGVPEYFIIDAQWSEFEDDMTANYIVLGYRLDAGTYIPMTPDERGWLYSATTGVWIGATPARDDFIIVDAATGERLLPDDTARIEAERRAAEAEQRAAEAEAARIEAERRAAEAEQANQTMQAELARLREQLAHLQADSK